MTWSCASPDLQAFGLNLELLLTAGGKELVLSEFGVGGGATATGDTPARNYTEVRRHGHAVVGCQTSAVDQDVNHSLCPSFRLLVKFAQLSMFYHLQMSVSCLADAANEPDKSSAWRLGSPHVGSNPMSCSSDTCFDCPRTCRPTCTRTTVYLAVTPGS